jgi:hypothetical protein
VFYTLAVDFISCESTGTDMRKASLWQVMRFACTYVGAQRLKELPKRTTFIRVNNQLNNIFGKEQKY